MLNPLQPLLHSAQWSRWLTTDPGGAVVAIASLLLWVVALRLVLMAGLVAVARVQVRTGAQQRATVTTRVAARVAPRFARGLLIAGCTASLTIPALVAPANAAGGTSLDRPAAPSATSPLQPPALAVTPVTAPDHQVQPTHQTPHTAHVIRPGECLWSIARDELGPRATDAQIAARWPEWWRANAITVGSNPNLVFPGGVLHQPGQTASSTEGSAS